MLELIIDVTLVVLKKCVCTIFLNLILENIFDFCMNCFIRNLTCKAYFHMPVFREEANKHGNLNEYEKIIFAHV